eukprot:superscaffoldBa00000657_g6369
MDELAALVRNQRDFYECNAMCFTETWLQEDTPDPIATADSFQTTRTLHPSGFFVISGDFNHVTLDKTFPTFTQFVDCNTRECRTLNLLKVNVKEVYSASALPPHGRSDHNRVHHQPRFDMQSHNDHFDNQPPSNNNTSNLLTISDDQHPPSLPPPPPFFINGPDVAAAHGELITQKTTQNG